MFSQFLFQGGKYDLATLISKYLNLNFYKIIITQCHISYIQITVFTLFFTYIPNFYDSIKPTIRSLAMSF